MLLRLFKDGVDDLTLCSSPSGGEITAQLGARFDRQLIYTAIADTLISVNPYKYLPITTDDHITLYQNATGQVPPHIYNIAEQAFRRLCDDRESQCVIISGESGSGKVSPHFPLPPSPPLEGKRDRERAFGVVVFRKFPPFFFRVLSESNSRPDHHPWSLTCAHTYRRLRQNSS
jgi:hypothetical protein